ncbi:hypothetical protein V8C34DRAFT_314693 [Trichoderma compactum]
MGIVTTPVLQWTHEDKDHNKQQIPAALHDAYTIIQTANIRYENRQAPWRMLVRSYPIELPKQLTKGNSQHKDFNKSLFGDWLIIVYTWATDPTWLLKTNIMDIVSLDSVTRDPVPARLAGLRCLLNGRARDLYRATYEYENV